MLRKEFQSRQFMFFMIVGGIAALVNFLTRILYNDYMNYEWAVFFAYITGMITAYVLSRYFVFGGSNGSRLTEFYRFSIVNLFAIIQVWFISVGLAIYLFPFINYEFYAYEVAHIIGLSIPIFTSFIGHKYFSFKKG